jgi:hypothetical protein
MLRLCRPLLNSLFFTVLSAILAPGVIAQETLRIGAPLPLTGPLSPEGIKQQRGYDLWAETANAKGGIKAGGKAYWVQIVYVDYASNTPRAVQSAERLITEDKVNFLFPPFGSGGLLLDPKLKCYSLTLIFQGWNFGPIMPLGVRNLSG